PREGLGWAFHTAPPECLSTERPSTREIFFAIRPSYCGRLWPRRKAPDSVRMAEWPAPASTVRKRTSGEGRSLQGESMRMRVSRFWVPLAAGLLFFGVVRGAPRTPAAAPTPASTPEPGPLLTPFAFYQSYLGAVEAMK